MPAQPYEVKDFSGGVTDNFLSGPNNRGQKFDNLLINNNKKPFTRWGSVIEDDTNTQITSGIKRISYLWDHRNTIIRQSESHLFYINVTYPELQGPTANDAFDGATESSKISQTFWNNHSILVCDNFCNPQKVYFDGTSNLQLRNAGLPVISAPTVTAGAAGVKNYIYAFHYYYSYVVEGVTFEDDGPTVQVELLLTAEPSSNAVSITNIPVIANGTADNWDTTNIKVKIFRTETDSTVLKYVGQVTNGTTTYSDTASDASIIDAVQIYTTGGVVDNDPPPPAKFIHVANDIALYGWVKEGGIEYATKVRQSIKSDFDSCPEDFYLEFPQRVTGISSYQGTFIVFCEGSIHRVDGFFDELGRGGMASLKISDTTWCVSNDSIVQTDTGLYFAGKDGWYFTNGYSVQKISKHLNDTYKTLVSTTTQERNIWGSFDKNEKRIWYAVQQASGSLDNDSFFILDLNWGMSEEMTFTTASSGRNFRPTAILFKDTYMYRADTRGYVFKHNSSYLTDPKVDTIRSVSVWDKATIIHLYKSCAFDFGTSYVKKYVPQMLLTLANRTNISAVVTSINDDGRNMYDLKELRYDSNITWGDNDIPWGQADLVWNKLGIIEQLKKFPAKSLWCNYKQIQITNGYTIVRNSDVLGQATVDPVAKTATLTTATNAWPDDSVDYYISFADDAYDTEFLVTTRSSDTALIFQDVANAAPAAANYKWLLKGYRKGEMLEILSYVIHYHLTAPNQDPYHSIYTATGENAPTVVP